MQRPWRTPIFVKKAQNWHLSFHICIDNVTNVIFCTHHHHWAFLWTKKTAGHSGEWFGFYWPRPAKYSQNSKGVPIGKKNIFFFSKVEFVHFFNRKRLDGWQDWRLSSFWLKKSSLDKTVVRIRVDHFWDFEENSKFQLLKNYFIDIEILSFFVHNGYTGWSNVYQNLKTLLWFLHVEKLQRPWRTPIFVKKA